MLSCDEEPLCRPSCRAIQNLSEQIWGSMHYWFQFVSIIINGCQLFETWEEYLSFHMIWKLVNVRAAILGIQFKTWTINGKALHNLSENFGRRIQRPCSTWKIMSHSRWIFTREIFFGKEKYISLKKEKYFLNIWGELALSAVHTGCTWAP